MPTRSISSERQLKKRILALLRSHGFLCWSNGAGPFSPVGFPDISFIANGVTHYIEVKVGNNKPTKPQQAWIKQLVEAGVPATTVWSIEELEMYLKTWGIL